MVDTRLLVRIDAFLGLFALLLVLATFYLVVRAPLVGVFALVVLALGLYALGSYIDGFLDGVDDGPSAAADARRGAGTDDGGNAAATADAVEGEGGEAATGSRTDARE